MILYLSRMRRNVNPKLYNDRENVSVIASETSTLNTGPVNYTRAVGPQPRATVRRRLRFQTALSSRETYRFTRHVVGWSRANARRQRARHLPASRETTSLGGMCVIRRDISRGFHGDRALCNRFALVVTLTSSLPQPKSSQTACLSLKPHSTPPQSKTLSPTVSYTI